MKKAIFLLMLIFLSAEGYQLLATSPDSLNHIQLEDVVVSATRASVNTPISHTNISLSDIRKENAARNIPAILQTTPSLVSFTEDGLGVGNTYLRIRGTDATRINVTLNGMPLNNPETQEVFWVNLPDLSNSLQNIQIQRGVGTSTNGSASFGASISLQTRGAHSESYGEASTAVGSYGTFLSNIAMGTGILNNGLSLDARFSRVLGEGYIRNASVNHTNFYGSLSHYTDKQLIRLSYLKGVQHTGITWEGVSKEQMEDPEYARRYNPAGEYYDDAGNRLYYKNETDNYYSDILQLTFSRELNQYLSMNVGLSYNHGYGYYENYRHNKKYSDFGIIPQTVEGITYERSDFIRQKLMENDYYVSNFSLNFSRNNLNILFGGMYSFYYGDHFGKLPWIKHNENIKKDFEWYNNLGEKSDINVFTRADYQFNDIISLFGDLQYRNVRYVFNGIDDDLEDLTGDFTYNFFNPKAGISIRINNQNQIYASVAVGQREPLRADLKDGIKGGAINPIHHESMIDYELGYRFNKTNELQLGANLYLMDYNNQMVQTGKLTDIGYKLMENVKDSYRAGIELEVSVPIWKNKILLDANGTFSSNKIKKYVAWLDHYDNQENWNWEGQISKEYGLTNISYSPNFISAVGVTWKPNSAFYLNLMGKYVSKQYMDNTSDDEKSIDAYLVSNLSAGYTFNKTTIGIFNLQIFVNNLFNKEYVANGWAATDTFADGTYINWIGYYPQATRNYMARLTLSF